MNKLVSIIIPTFNRANIIGETLDSVLNQIYQNWECLIIDDGSTDNSIEIIENYTQKDSRFQYHKRPENITKGVSTCRNIGFKKSKGVFLNFIDSDDIITTNHIEVHLENFSKYTIECSVTNAKNFIDNMENQKNYWSKNILAEDMILEMIKNDVLWAIGSVFWSKECFKTQNPFIEEIINSEEWAFHLFQIINGCNYHINPETTYLVRNHENRAGRTSSYKKVYSIYKARVYVFELLNLKKILNKERELYLLKDIFFALRLSIKDRCLKLSLMILFFLFKNIFNFYNKIIVLKIIFVASPIYFFIKKGEKLFKL